MKFVFQFKDKKRVPNPLRLTLTEKGKRKYFNSTNQVHQMTMETGKTKSQNISCCMEKGRPSPEAKAGSAHPAIEEQGQRGALLPFLCYLLTEIFSHFPLTFVLLSGSTSLNPKEFITCNEIPRNQCWTLKVHISRNYGHLRPHLFGQRVLHKAYFKKLNIFCFTGLQYL